MKWLVRSNFFIAICAFVATMATFIFFDKITFNYFYYSVAILFGTKLVYTFLRLDKKIFNPSVLQNFIKQNILFLLIGLLSLFLSNAIAHHYLLLAFALLVCVFYGIHIFGAPFKKISLRTFAWFKLLSIAFVWTVVTVLIPLLLIEHSVVFTGKEYLFLVAQFIFIFSLSLPFDMVDHIRQDLLGFKTVPKVLGIDMAKKLARFLMFSCWMIFGFVSITWFFAISICMLLYLLFLNRNLQEIDISRFALQFDGLIILFNGLSILFHFIW